MPSREKEAFVKTTGKAISPAPIQAPRPTLAVSPSRRVALSGWVVLLLFALCGNARPQATQARDPGVRPGSAAGGPIDNLTPGELKLFNDGQVIFAKVDTIASDGLGPRMNFDSCSGCHAQPSSGGSGAKPNPQFQLIKRLGLHNALPFFITENGPTREARFQKTSAGAPDGGVHDLFTITGRSDASGCDIAQPDFRVLALQPLLDAVIWQ